MIPVRVLATLGTYVLSGSLSMLAQSQPPITILNPTNPNPMPGDARMTQFDFEVKDESWRVFAVNSLPDAPTMVVKVEEVKQHNPPSKWGVHVLNRGLMPVNSLVVAAAIVDINGKVKATQPLAAIKNLAPGQVQRREMRVVTTVLAPTDRVVFFVQNVISEMGNWKSVNAQVAALIKDAAARLPVP
jgi:hypothetical protein